jgi:hypothetical protein
MESSSTSPSELSGNQPSTGEKAKVPSSTQGSLTLPRLVSYRLITGSSAAELETRVNYFLQQSGNDYFACIGPPDMFGHELFVQGLQGYK